MSRKKLRVKLALLFLFIMTLASVCSFIVSLFVMNRSVRADMMAGQGKVANKILELSSRTDLPADDIIRLSGDTNYKAVMLPDSDLANLSGEERSKLDNGEIVYIQRGLMPFGITLLRMDGTPVMIRPQWQSITFVRSELHRGLTLIFSVIIGTIMIALGSKRALRSIRTLNDATKEVARGNFNIEIQKNSDDEIGELTESFNKMTAELKGIEMFRQDFISNVSHEFKTPIASIHGFAELLKSGSLTEEERNEYTDIILSESGRLSRLISNILNLSRLENQEIVVEKAEFDLDENIRRIILLMEPEWSKKDINFDLQLEHIRFYGSEELLSQVWMNLIGNAIKFSDIGSEIGVRLYSTGTSIKVKVIDNGSGIDDETMEHIFEKFYQGDKARSSEGNGLGLALVKRIVELCGGKVYAKSPKGKGTTFTVELKI